MANRALFSALSVLGLSGGVDGSHFPRPDTKDKARVARWLVHESDYAVSSTTCKEERLGCAFKGQPFGDIMSISDGNGLDDSTGIVYTYIPGLDSATQDLMADPRMSLTFTEKAIGCKGDTAEDPPCARLTIAGKMTPVPDAQKDTAMKYLLARHPQMKAWSQAHVFEPYYMAKENISSFFFIDFYGGATNITVDEYMAADPKPKALADTVQV